MYNLPLEVLASLVFKFLIQKSENHIFLGESRKYGIISISMLYMLKYYLSPETTIIFLTLFYIVHKNFSKFHFKGSFLPSLSTCGCCVLCPIKSTKTL